MLKIFTFWVFNSLLPGSDVGSDLFTFIDLYRNQHYRWAAITLLLTFNPFIIHTSMFCFDFTRAKCSRKPFDTNAKAKELLIHVPFFLPFLNCYNTWRLYNLRFGMKGFQDKNMGEVEQIQEKAGAAGMYESFTEAGPQSVVQLVIILSTGRISTAQKVSLPISICSLTIASSRAFFIQRSRDERDPDPAIKTLLLYIFPRMLLVVLNNLILWTIIGGLVSGYFLLAIGLCFVNVFVSLSGFPRMKKGNTSEIGVIITLAYLNTHVYVFCGILMGFFTDFIAFSVVFSLSLATAAAFCIFKLKRKISQWRSAPPSEAIELETTGEESDVTETEKSNEDSEEDESSHFKAISALTSIWLPCVIGDRPYLFLASAMLSMTNKICLLILAVVLNYTSSIETNDRLSNVFLLWCRDFETVKQITVTKTMKICQEPLNDQYPDIPSCSSWWNERPNDTRLYQLTRICGDSQDENLLRLFLLLVVIISTSLSSLAVYQLHRISNYIHLYKISKKFVCCRTRPIVHRSLLFRLAEKDENEKQLKEFLDDSTPDMVNRTRRGETALHISARFGAHECSVKLLQYQAEIKHNSSGEFPDLLRDTDLVNKLNQSILPPQKFWKLAYQKLPAETFWRLAWQTNLDKESGELEKSINQYLKHLKFSPKKCVFIGDGAVGKSCLIMTQSSGQFPPGYTPGQMWAQTDLAFLKVQDTQGQEEYDQGTKLTLRNVHIIIVCFSLIEPDSFKNVKDKWLKLYSRYLHSDTHVMLVGTKLDLREDLDEIEKLKGRGLLPITTEEGESLAKELKAVKYMECSAATKVGLQDVFDEIFKISHQLGWR